MRDQYEVEVTLPNERSHLLFDAGKKLTLVSENADWYAYSAGQNLHYFRQVQKNGINVLATMRYLQEHAMGKNRKAGQQSCGGLGYMQAIVVSMASLYFSISGASAENNSTTVTKDKVTLAKFECPNKKSPELAASWLATIPPSQLPKVNDPVIYNAISEIQWPVLPDSQTSKLFSKAADRMYAKIAEREGKLDLTAIDKQLTSIGIKKPNEKITFSLSDALGQDSIWADKVIDAHISNLKIQPSLPCEKVYSEYAALFHPNEKSPLRYGRRPEVQTTRPGTLDSGGISLQPFSPTNPVLRPDQVQLNALGRLPIPYDPLGFPEVVYLYSPDLKKACTGTLLSSTWVLTAAHCIEYDFDRTRKKPLEMWVTAHSHEVERDNRGTPAQTLFSKAKNFHPHPMYEKNKSTPQEAKFDVALIELETGIKVAHYAVIGKAQKSKIWGTVAGFGPNLAEKVNSSFTLDVGWSLVDIGADTVLWKPIGIINGTETSSLPCPGDSGGPIYQLFKNDGAVFVDRIGQGYKDEPRRIIALVSKSRKYENEKGGLKSGKCSLYSEIEGPILETHRPWICETSNTCTVS